MITPFRMTKNEFVRDCNIGEQSVDMFFAHKFINVLEIIEEHFLNRFEILTLTNSFQKKVAISNFIEDFFALPSLSDYLSRYSLLSEFDYQDKP